MITSPTHRPKATPMYAQEGVSLIELAVVIAIIVSVFGAMVVLNQKQMRFSKYEQTLEQMRIIDETIKRYALRTGALPCPASRDLLISDAAYGTETGGDDCDGAASGVENEDSGRVRIGAVPVRELALHDDMMLDAWGMRISYAVVKTYTESDGLTEDPIDHHPGAGNGIRLLDEHGNDLLDTSTHTDLPNDHFIAYVLISHGENMRGAYNRLGVQAIACDSNLADGENCDEDDANFTDIPLSNELSTSNNNFFDDLVLWRPVYMVDPKLRHE